MNNQVIILGLVFCSGVLHSRGDSWIGKHIRWWGYVYDKVFMIIISSMSHICSIGNHGVKYERTLRTTRYPWMASGLSKVYFSVSQKCLVHTNWNLPGSAQLKKMVTSHVLKGVCGTCWISSLFDHINDLINFFFALNKVTISSVLPKPRTR